MAGNSDLIIFDLDGVLVDSELLSAELIISMAAELGADISLLHVKQNYIGRSFSKVITNLESEFDLLLPKNFERTYLDRLAVLFHERLQPTVGIHDILNAITCKFCIATSSPMERAVRSLKACRLTDYFVGTVFTASMVEKPKPAPDIFLFAAHTMGCDPAACLVIEDSEAGIKAGLAAGMTTARFVGGSHLKGGGSLQPMPDGLATTFDNWEDFPLLYPSFF